MFASSSPGSFTLEEASCPVIMSSGHAMEWSMWQETEISSQELWDEPLSWPQSSHQMTASSIKDSEPEPPSEAASEFLTPRTCVR